jgi:hypothetical protein
MVQSLVQHATYQAVYGDPLVWQQSVKLPKGGRPNIIGNQGKFGVAQPVKYPQPD